MSADRDDELLAESFMWVARSLRGGMRDALAPLDLAPSHSRALGTLLRHGPMRLGALSEHLHIAPRTATELVDALEQRGLAAREPDPSDRRATIASATDDGKHVMFEARRASMRQADHLFDRLSATDRADLARILRKLRD